MPYIANNPAASSGEVPGSGQCVALVPQASGASLTAQWTRGQKGKCDGTVQTGTAIATFDANGKYSNSADGSSHAAIYAGQNAIGLQVWGQPPGKPVHQRTIRFQGGAPGVKPVNDGDAYYVIA
jgi:hypothetical protein